MREPDGSGRVKTRADREQGRWSWGRCQELGAAGKPQPGRPLSLGGEAGLAEGTRVLPGHSRGKGTPTWRVMMSCREKGSSVSRSRKFLALIFSCSTACSQEGAHGYRARPDHVPSRGSRQRPRHGAQSLLSSRYSNQPSQQGSPKDTPVTHI